MTFVTVPHILILMKHSYKLFVVAGLGLLSLGIVRLFFMDARSVSNFEECVARNGRVLKTEPAQCAYSNLLVSVVLTDLPESRPLSVSELLNQTINDRYTVSGMVKTGQSAGVEHCQDRLYVTDGLKVLQLRQDRDGELVSFEESSLIGAEVVLSGVYLPENGLCKALLCQCDPYLIVETINQ